MNNVLLIDTDNISAYYTIESLSRFKGLNVMTANNLADAYDLVTKIPFIVLIYHAMIEIDNTESFVEKTQPYTIQQGTRFFIYYGDHNPELFKKFNYESLTRVNVFGQPIDINELINKIAEIVKSKNVPKKYSMDVNFVNPFIKSSISTLEMMCFVQNLTHLAPKLYSSNLSQDPTLHLEIVGTLEMESPNFKGRLSLCFPKKTFLKITSNMLGANYTEITPEIEDSAAELTNIIYGQTKKILSEKGYSFNKSFPKVVINNDKIHQLFKDNLTIYIPFLCEEGKFFVFVTVYN